MMGYCTEIFKEHSTGGKENVEVRVSWDYVCAAFEESSAGSMAGDHTRADAVAVPCQSLRLFRKKL
jgi:hypothetical protein